MPANNLKPTPLFDTVDNLKNNNTVLPKELAFAKYDYDISLDFLNQYSGNQATFNAYRREVERLIQWSWLIRKKSIIELSRDDIDSYIEFCLKPDKNWISLKKSPRFLAKNGQRVPNPQWRPFVVTKSKAALSTNDKITLNDHEFSKKAIKEIFVILSSFYNYLILDNIIEANPVASIRQKSKFIRKSQTSPQIPRLTKIQWYAVIEATEKLAQSQPQLHERTLFMLNAMYYMYLRISELVASDRWVPLMKHFFQDSKKNWWFITVGKGNKERTIAVSNSMLEALKRWRQYLELSPALPSPLDNNPLIPKIRGKGGITSTRWINELIQTCFDEAVIILNKNNQQDEAQMLKHATVHWLRHTGISDDINERGRPVAHVRDDAGHSNISTTDKYNDITLQERHASAKSK